MPEEISVCPGIHWLCGILVIALMVAATTMPVTMMPAAAADRDAERAQLEKSLLSACKNFDSERDWAALDACNRAWFREHEKAVWELNLNPHGKTAAKPSS